MKVQEKKKKKEKIAMSTKESKIEREEHANWSCNK
jgi:hypothetical protein